MPLSDIVNVQITIESAKVEKAGFGIPLILAADCPGGFTERVRFYTSITEVSDDFASTTATYKMAAVVFAQDPKLPELAVGRLEDCIPTMSWLVTPVVSINTDYEIEVDGTLSSITSDGATSATEICDALRTAISATGLTEGGTTTLTLTAGTPAAFHSVKVIDTTRLKIAQTTDITDTDLEADLDAIALEDSTWYCILCPFASKEIIETISDWAESHEKLYVAQTQDSDVINLSVSGDTGGSETIAGDRYAAEAMRTALIYHPDNSEFADGAWAGVGLPFDPGSETWALKSLTGVAYVNLTGTQRTNALNKYANVFERVAGRNVTNEGTVSGGEYIDVIRGRDWLKSEIATEVFANLAKAKKVPFTDAGIAMVEGILRAKLKVAVDVGLLASDPAPKVTVPKAADVSASDKAARKLTGVKFDAVLAGAIHKVLPISGVLTV